MSGEKELVITAYGHDATIDQIAVSDFGGLYDDTKIYLDTINSLEPRGNSWVFARIISSAARYAPASLLPPPPPMRFDVVLRLDDRAVQKTLREIDAQELAKALKGAAEPIKEKIFGCMSGRAVQMLKEDMEFMGPVRLRDVEEARERILNIIRHLESNGEIIINPPKKGDERV